MVRLLVGGAMALALVFGSSGVPVQADPGGLLLDIARQSNPSACGGGDLVADVTQPVANNRDFGAQRQLWAIDTYTRRIRIWQTAPTTYCVIITSTGSFVTTGDSSPEGTGALRPGITGVFNLAHRTNQFTASWSPSAPSSGSLPAIDLGCDASGACTNFTALSWQPYFFTDRQGQQEVWYGGFYDAGPAGLWINTSVGDDGDIVG